MPSYAEQRSITEIPSGTRRTDVHFESSKGLPRFLFWVFAPNLSIGDAVIEVANKGQQLYT